MERQLDKYRSAFGQHNRGPTGLRSEIEVELNPGDQVARVRIGLGHIEVAQGQKLEMIRLGTRSLDPHVEVTNLRSSDDGILLELEDVRDGVAIVASRTGPTTDCDVTVEFLVWDAVAPIDGVAPYLHSTLDLTLKLTAANRKPTLLNLMTPSESGPRSTQGNFRVAYPSALWNGKRITRIYYPSSTLRLHYRVGATEGLTAPWLSLGRAAVSALFVFMILDITTTVDNKDRLIALIAAFFAVAGVLWELLRDSAGFSLYDAWRKRIQLIVIMGHIVLIGAMVLALLALTRLDLLRETAAAASLVIVVLLSCAAIGGLVLHTIGYWHGFVCDHEGCSNTLRRRRHHIECHYTGRVFCGEHQISMCDFCQHGDDARTGRLRTRELFGTIPTPCGAVEIRGPAGT